MGLCTEHELRRALLTIAYAGFAIRVSLAMNLGQLLVRDRKQQHGTVGVVIWLESEAPQGSIVKATTPSLLPQQPF